MSRGLTRLLHEAADQLADEARPVDLTGPALRIARASAPPPRLGGAAALVLLAGLGLGAARLGSAERPRIPAAQQS